jgi:HD-like signal output (HDOD) protein/CheY-like chemotaxis protein
MQAPYRALIVDDNLPIQRLSALALQQNGFECECTGDGLHASQLVRQSKFDVVVTELRIPNKHGHALTLELLEQKPRPVIVIHTGFKEPRLVKDLLLRGVDDIVFKPLDFAIIAAKVYALVQRRNNGSYAQLQRHRPSANGGLARVTLEQLSGRVARFAQLLPGTRAALEVYEMTSRHDHEVSGIAAAIERDVSITTNVLDLANSASYNADGQRTFDLEQAVVRVGQHRVNEIALMAHVLSVISPQAAPWMNLELVSKRSMAAGIVIDSLVKQGAHSEIDAGLSLSAFVHPLGRMVLGFLFPELYDTMLKGCKQNEESLREQERRTFPVSHTEIAALLLDNWSIPRDNLLPLRLSFDDFSSLARVAEPLRTKAELSKAAILLGRLAIGHWDEWDLIQLPPASVLRRLGAKQPQKLVHQARLDLNLPTIDRRTKLPVVEMGSNRHVSYCDLSGAESDLMEELLRSLGLTLHACQPDDLQQVETPLIANCIGRVSSQSVMKLPPATTLIVTDPERVDLFPRFSNIAVLPASFSTFRNAILSILGH